LDCSVAAGVVQVVEELVVDAVVDEIEVDDDDGDVVVDSVVVDCGFSNKDTDDVGEETVVGWDVVLSGDPLVRDAELSGRKEAALSAAGTGTVDAAVEVAADADTGWADVVSEAEVDLTAVGGNPSSVREAEVDLAAVGRI